MSMYVYLKLHLHLHLHLHVSCCTCTCMYMSMSMQMVMSMSCACVCPRSQHHLRVHIPLYNTCRDRDACQACDACRANHIDTDPCHLSKQQLIIAMNHVDTQTPVISPSSSSDDLGNTQAFPYFLRTVPADSYQTLGELAHAALVVRSHLHSRSHLAPCSDTDMDMGMSICVAYSTHNHA